MSWLGGTAAGSKPGRAPKNEHCPLWRISWSGPGGPSAGSAAGSTTGIDSAQACGGGLHNTSSAMAAAMETSWRIIR